MVVLPFRITKIKMLRNPHFWAGIIIILALFFIYMRWPWREWQFEGGVWQWFSGLSSLYTLALFEAEHHFIGILFFIPILYATIIFRSRGTIIFSSLSLAGVLPLIMDIWVNVSSWVTNLSFLLLPVVIVALIQLELELRRKHRIACINEQRKYTVEVLEAQEEERHRIARELHDETIQGLVAIARRAESILSSGNNEGVLWIKNNTIQTIEGLRRITLDLRPAVLDDLGLVPGLRWLVDHVTVDCNTHMRLIVDGFERKLPVQTEIAVFRIVQEALNNIKHHSQAEEAFVTLQFTPESLKIRIKDNGQGFLSPGKQSKLAARRKLGLIGIRERIESLGGMCQIYSERGSGTDIFIEMKC
jgi:signal transduction histidine kinase